MNKTIKKLKDDLIISNDKVRVLSSNVEELSLKLSESMSEIEAMKEQQEITSGLLYRLTVSKDQAHKDAIADNGIRDLKALF